MGVVQVEDLRLKHWGLLKLSKHEWKCAKFEVCMCLFQNSKVRRFAFELKMQDKSTFLLAADSEAEMEEWIGTLNKILHSSFEQAMQEKRNGDLHDGTIPSLWHLNTFFACVYLSAFSPCLLMLAAPAGFPDVPEIIYLKDVSLLKLLMLDLFFLISFLCDSPFLCIEKPRSRDPHIIMFLYNCIS